MGFSFLSKSKDIDILSSVPDGLMLVDESGNIEWLNEQVCVLLRTDRNVLLKQNIELFIESGLDLIRQATNSTRSVVGHLISDLSKDLYVEITAKTANTSYVVALRDVTQNYKTVTNILVEHECSKRSNNDKNNFLVKLSNELKSPIQSVIGFSQAMIDGLGGAMSERQEKYVKIINKNSSDVLYLLDKIIDLAKTEANLFDYDFQIFDAVNTVQNVLKTFEPLAAAKNIEMSLDTSDVIKKTIFSDENALKLALQNVFETSLNLTDIGSISVRVAHPDQELVEAQGFEIPQEFSEKSYLLISVSDTGAGFVSSDLDILFDPYAQLEKTNKKNIVRSLALTSSRNMIKHLKGNIWIESEPMQGTVYNIIIPVGKFM